MYFVKKNPAEKRKILIKNLKSKKLLRFPGAYSPLVAKLIEEIGFEGVYVSGAVVANDLGFPDIGLTTLSEVSNRAEQISRVTNLPTIADADTGFGEIMNCARTIERFENSGVCGCHIEDQINPKRCGHLDNKEIISASDMIKKIKSAAKAKKDKNFLVIARTDANSVEGLKKTIDRIKAYVDAGADMIFPEAMKNEKEFEQVRECTSAYILANMTEFGKSKLLTTKQIKNLGLNIVIYPVTTQRLAMKSVEIGLGKIFKDGHQKNVLKNMQTRKRLYELVNYEKYGEFDKNIFKFSKKGHE